MMGARVEPRTTLHPCSSLRLTNHTHDTRRWEMADDNVTLTTFYTAWKAYQERLAALAPLTAEQLALRAAPGLRSIGETAAHIIGCRVGWFTITLGEDVGADVRALGGAGRARPIGSRAGAGPRPYLADDDRVPDPLESCRYGTNRPRRLGWSARSVVARLDRLACARARPAPRG